MNTSRVLRYPLQIADYQEVVVPWPAQLLSAAIGKGGNIDLWAVANDGGAAVVVPIYIVGTGHPMPDGIALGVGGFIGTVVMGQLVWHIWHGKQR